MVLPLPRRKAAPKGERAAGWKSAGRELAAVARQALLLRHDVSRPVLPDAARPGDDVVVLLHGLCATAGVLRPLRARLERHPGVHTATMTYPPGPAGVRPLCRRLEGLTAELPDGVRLHLVGHSLGGVVARYYAKLGRDPRVVQTISLAAPFAGVRWSRLGAGLGIELCRDLDPRSALLRELVLGSRRALGVPHISVIAEDDAVAGAPLSHALPGGDVALVRRCGHNGLLFHEEAAAIVERRVLEYR